MQQSFEIIILNVFSVLQIFMSIKLTLHYKKDKLFASDLPFFLDSKQTHSLISVTQNPLIIIFLYFP